jgi:hypothetical protein
MNYIKIYLILACFFTGSKINIVLSQKESSFSGELTYSITKISSDKLENDFSLGDEAVEEKMIIYAKDSLVKRVHFSSVNGIQESISHLRLEKKILLLTLDSIDFAIQLPSEEVPSAKKNSYTFKKKCFPKKKIAGIKGFPMVLSHKMLSNDLHIWYSKTIPAKYNKVFPSFEGLPLKYYIVSEKGLYLYTLLSLKEYDPPLALFQIPKNYQLISLKDFLSLTED